MQGISGVFLEVSESGIRLIWSQEKRIWSGQVSNTEVMTTSPLGGPTWTTVSTANETRECFLDQQNL